jgi:hypothetical protein
MRLILSILMLCCLPLIATAGVYKWVDPDGTVHYGDTPREGAEEIHVAPPQTYTPAPLPSFSPRPEAPVPVPAYTRFELTAPADDGTVRDNTGAISVSFAVEPALKVEQGHRLVVLLDGQAGAPTLETTVTLENVDRGTHTLQGQIIDANGKVLITSSSIKVHLHRQSVMMPHRAPPPPPTVKKAAP